MSTGVKWDSLASKDTLQALAISGKRDKVICRGNFSCVAEMQNHAAQLNAFLRYTFGKEAAHLVVKPGMTSITVKKGFFRKAHTETVNAFLLGKETISGFEELPEAKIIQDMRDALRRYTQGWSAVRPVVTNNFIASGPSC